MARFNPSKIKNMETNDEKKARVTFEQQPEKNNPYPYKIGDKVMYPSDNCPFIVTGVRPNEVRIYGDFSGGVSYLRQEDWVHINDVTRAEPEAAGQEQEEGDTAHWMKKYEVASQQTASLQKQVEELREENERLKKVLKYAHNKAYILYKNKGAVSIGFLRDAEKLFDAMEQALNPQDNQKEK